MRDIKIKVPLILICISFFCSPGVYAGDQEIKGKPEALQALEEMSSDHPEVVVADQKDAAAQKEIEDGQKKQDLRYTTIKETAMMVGIQTGVKWRYDQINVELERISQNLDSIYDFSMLVEHNGQVLPPIIQEAHNALQIKSTIESLSSQIVYRILQDAQIISVQPTWRQYLYKSFAVIEEINHILLPQNDVEQKMWAAAANRGWEIGVKQADRVFDANLSALDRDYRGLLTYKMLAMQNVISVPMVAEGDLGIQIRNKTLDVNQRVFRITNSAGFNKEDEWTPIGHMTKNQ